MVEVVGAPVPEVATVADVQAMVGHAIHVQTIAYTAVLLEIPIRLVGRLYCLPGADAVKLAKHLTEAQRKLHAINPPKPGAGRPPGRCNGIVAQARDGLQAPMQSRVAENQP